MSPRTNHPRRRASDRAPKASPPRVWIWVVCIAVAFVLVVGGLVLPRSVSRSLREHSPAWSADGRRIVFVAERDETADLFMMDADGTDRTQLTSTRWRERAPAFSPDGRRIALESDRDGNSEIYTIDDRGGDWRRLTNDAAQDRSPAWSPDGHQIAYVSDRGGGGQNAVFVMNADGSGLRQLTSGSGAAPQFAPDGRRLAIEGDRVIALIDLATGATTTLGAAADHDMMPAWSPGGDRLAFVTTRNGRAEIFTMDADGSGAKLLVTLPGQSVLSPRWSPDGTLIAFVAATDVLNPSTSTGEAIFVLNLASGRLSRLSR